MPTIPAPDPEPEDQEPLDLGDAVPIAQVGQLIDHVDGAAQAASWGWSIPPADRA